MIVYFDTLHLYYLTQYLPVYRELARRRLSVVFVFYRNPASDAAARYIIDTEELPAVWVDTPEDAAALYRRKGPDWVVFGNGFAPLAKLGSPTRTAQLYHGIGMKNDVYQPGLMKMDIRFTEGPHYTDILARLFPGRPMCEVGYAKLDPLFGPAEDRPAVDLAGAGLSSSRPTLLYAPTFYPSSIEMMPDDLPARFAGFNLIVKPHMFTYSKPRYEKQRRKLARWATHANCLLVEAAAFNLLPYMNTADLMISDASSALFEFAALNKPVIWCDFLKLRWTYRGPFRYRFRRRMDQRIDRYSDIGRHAPDFETLGACVRHQLRHRGQFEAKRREYTARLIGVTDGRVSVRIADYLETTAQ